MLNPNLKYSGIAVWGNKVCIPQTVISKTLMFLRFLHYFWNLVGSWPGKGSLCNFFLEMEDSVFNHRKGRGKGEFSNSLKLFILAINICFSTFIDWHVSTFRYSQIVLSYVEEYLGQYDNFFNVSYWLWFKFFALYLSSTSKPNI